MTKEPNNIGKTWDEAEKTAKNRVQWKAMVVDQGERDLSQNVTCVCGSFSLNSCLVIGKW